MAPIRHMAKRVTKSVSMSLSSFLSNVLLLEGTFMVFIITLNSNKISVKLCQLTQIDCLDKEKKVSSTRII